MQQTVIIDESSEIPKGVFAALSASDEVQQERAAKALVRHMVSQLPAPNYSIRQRKGFLNNGVNQNALMANLVSGWGPRRG